MKDRSKKSVVCTCAHKKVQKFTPASDRRVVARDDDGRGRGDDRCDRNLWSRRRRCRRDRSRWVWKTRANKDSRRRAQPVDEAERTKRTTDDANARVSRFAALARVRQECLKSSERAGFALKVRRDDRPVAKKARLFSTRLAAVRLNSD